MKSTSIADAKSNLSHLIQSLESEKAVHLTRYGKPVAVIMSEAEYQSIVSPQKSLNAAILNWRSQYSGSSESGFRDEELQTLRSEEDGRDFTWTE